MGASTIATLARSGSAAASSRSALSTVDDPVLPEVRLGGGRDPLPGLGDDQVVEGEEAVFLSFEQAVEAAHADLRRGDDLVDGGGPVAAPGEDPGGGGQHPPALVLLDDGPGERLFSDGPWQ